MLSYQLSCWLGPFALFLFGGISLLCLHVGDMQQWALLLSLFWCDSEKC